MGGNLSPRRKTLRTARRFRDAQAPDNTNCRSWRANEVIALDPDDARLRQRWATATYTWAASRTPRRTMRRALDRKIAFPRFLLLRYSICLLKRRCAGTSGGCRRARASQGGGPDLHIQESLDLARSGRLQGSSTESSGIAVDWLGRARRNRNRAVPRFEAGAALGGLLREYAAARQRAIGALELSTGRDVQYARWRSRWPSPGNRRVAGARGRSRQTFSGGHVGPIHTICRRCEPSSSLNRTKPAAAAIQTLQTASGPSNSGRD